MLTFVNVSLVLNIEVEKYVPFIVMKLFKQSSILYEGGFECMECDLKIIVSTKQTKKKNQQNVRIY